MQSYSEKPIGIKAEKYIVRRCDKKYMKRTVLASNRPLCVNVIASEIYFLLKRFLKIKLA